MAKTQIAEMLLPDYVDKDLWDTYIQEVRVKKRYPCTERALMMLVRKLKDAYRIGYTVEQVNGMIEKAYTGGWSSFYQPKEPPARRPNLEMPNAPKSVRELAEKKTLGPELSPAEKQRKADEARAKAKALLGIG